MKTVFAALVTMILATTAQAERQPAWLCELDFDARASGAQVIVGKFSVKGKGNINCTNVVGRALSLPVTIDMSTGPVAPRIAIGNFEVNGLAANIALFAEEPSDLLGTYLVAQGQGAVLVGGGVFVATRADLPSLSLAVSINLVRGIGINAGVSKMKVALDSDRM